MKLESQESTERAAGLSLWERINKDPGFVASKRELQTRYGLPLPYDIRLNHQQWLEWQGRAGKPGKLIVKRGKAFAKDLRALFKKFEVPDAWQIDFIAEIAGLPSEGFADAGNLRINYYQAENGDWKWECIITPETDLRNPRTLEFIQSQQKAFAQPPPKPTKSQGSSRVDWRPVYEWHQRYPMFSIDELAEKIGYDPATVRRKFREFELGS
jgi:hypothetical protein